MALNTYEATEGEPVPDAPGSLAHTGIRDSIAYRLRQFLETNALGEAMVATKFQLSPDTVRVPDVAFVSAEHIEQVDPDRALAVPPALVIEVVSPNDLAAPLIKKVDQYLLAGASAVWVIYPNVREAHIFRADRSLRIVRNQELLVDEKVLPGFSLPLNTLFD
ncbi:MAG TPA: Uma2 family endonuclease [Verrucomicrobiae bacterium]|nr:Uma2 family endonuclease [Verrucomicrobiae bacterium]